MKLYILKNFCNYYNRRLRRYSSLSDYREFSTYTLSNANFNYGDGIMTSHVVGAISAYQGDGDYMVLTDDNNSTIISRWFVLENHYIRGGQCEILLRRDVVADFLTEIISAPCFIEKATISDVNDTAIFNKEPGMTYNQIKKRETLLKDKSQVPWLVGYYIRGEGVEVNASFTPSYALSDITTNGLSELDFYHYKDNPWRNYNFGNIYFNTNYSTGTYRYIATFNESSISTSTQNLSTAGNYYHTTPVTGDLSGFDDTWEAEVKANRALLRDYVNMYMGYPSADSKAQELLTLNGKIVYDSVTNEYYRVNINQSTATQGTYAIAANTFLANLLIDFGNTMGLTTAAGDYSNSYSDFSLFDIGYTSYQVSFTQLPLHTERGGGVSFSVSDVVATQDAAYNIFCLPYGEIEIVNGDSALVTSAEDSMTLMANIIQSNSGANPILIDAQLVPVCPYPNMISSTNTINLRKLSNKYYTPFTNSNGDTLGYVFHCPNAQFSSTLNYTINVDLDFLKIDNETKFCRLVSPNWNGQFEFSPAKNYGVDYFNLDCAFKPWQPYIHVAPHFKGLYGSRAKDAIGLVCGGDFGLSMTSDAFAAYERQNTNYQKIFDRQIQNLEVSQSIERSQGVANAITGTITGIGTGMAAGTAVGGLPGTIVGGVIGGVSSAAGGAMDVAMLDKAHAEAIGFSKDMFNYQMGNIRALPDSLTKVTSFNPNNHMFIILEYYGCSDTEEMALMEKLKYTGMTVGRIDTINTFINYGPQFIQGKLITIDGIEDAHLAYAIGQELSQGVYMQIGEGYNGYDPI